MYTQIPLGPLQTNAYVLYNEEKEAVLFDPGGDGAAFVNWIREQKLTPQAILLTHAHFDHIGALEEVRQAFACPVYLHDAEKQWLLDPVKNGSARMGREPIKTKPADHLLKDESTLKVGSFSFKLFHTPGHSPGSVSYYVADENIVFSGDALFQQGIGRTDLFGGNHELLLQSIHNKLLTLPEETIVASGHGPLTTIGQEMDHNPFLNGY
ncbi:MAG: Lactamase-B domain-containing protein [Shouchella clausii]|jgi:hydroxyacylglutathione hydrolase